MKSSVLKWLAVVAGLLVGGYQGAGAAESLAPPQPTASRPNFIVIMTDDQGYADLGITGSPNIRTPHIDRMAAEGMLLTSFYAAPFCTPSRAALMTGSYPPRVSFDFLEWPHSPVGLHPDEFTIAEMLKAQGYATMHIGK